MRRQREVLVRRQREAEQRRRSELADWRVRREAWNRQKYEVYCARKNLDRQVELMAQRERDTVGRGPPALRGSFSFGPARSGRGAVLRGAAAGRRGGLPSRPQAPPPDPQPSLSDVLGAVKALGQRLVAVEQREASLGSSRVEGAGAPVASSTPAPPRGPRRDGGAASASAPQFRAVDYRVAEGLVPAVSGVLGPALPMDSAPSPMDSTPSLL